MRKLVASMLMALDGVVENPQMWTVQFRSEESQKYKFDELFASSAADLSREGATSVFPSRYDHSRAVTTSFIRLSIVTRPERVGSRTGWVSQA